MMAKYASLRRMLPPETARIYHRGVLQEEQPRLPGDCVRLVGDPEVIAMPSFRDCASPPALLRLAVRKQASPRFKQQCGQLFALFLQASNPEAILPIRES